MMPSFCVDLYFRAEDSCTTHEQPLKTGLQYMKSAVSHCVTGMSNSFPPDITKCGRPLNFDQRSTGTPLDSTEPVAKA